MICDYCKEEVGLVWGDLLYPHRLDLYELRFWYCSDCDAWVGCHRGTTNPLGRLANAELRQAKQDAHVAFDRLWRATTPAGTFDRNGAYEWLADQLGIPRAECHIGLFDVEQCRLVVALCGFATAAAVQDREAMGE